jgi:hypothetical protein
LTNDSQPTPTGGNTKDDRRKTDRRKPPRPAASLLIWGILGLFVILAVLQSVLATLAAGTTLPYSEFKTLLREGRVVSAIVSTERVRGTMKTRS